MPLWDSLARQAQSAALAAPHGADDFVAIYDASAGAVHRTAVRNLRSRELFTVNMFTNVGASPAATTSTASPLRIFRTPYAFTVTSMVLACVVPNGATFSVDVFNNGLSVFNGGTILGARISLGSGVRRAEAIDFNGSPAFLAAADSEFRFYVTAAQTTGAIRMPQVTVMGYRT
jgi:hypothetical protein